MNWRNLRARFENEAVPLSTAIVTWIVAFRFLEPLIVSPLVLQAACVFLAIAAWTLARRCL